MQKWLHDNPWLKIIIRSWWRFLSLHRLPSAGRLRALPFSAMVKAPWIHPSKDAAVDQSRFRCQDPQDPRVLGRGPCGALHATPLNMEAEVPDWEVWGANPHARYSDCKRCYLRVRYFPKHHRTSHTMANTSPVAVQRTLDALRSQGIWHGMTYTDFRDEMKLTEGKIRMRVGRRPRRSRQSERLQHRRQRRRHRPHRPTNRLRGRSQRQRRHPQEPTPVLCRQHHSRHQCRPSTRLVGRRRHRGHLCRRLDPTLAWRRPTSG